MPGERVQRRVDRLLDEVEKALDGHDWAIARERCLDVLRLDSASTDAKEFLEVADRELRESADAGQSPTTAATQPEASEPASFAAGRYEVKRFLGQGGKKKVYLAHDTLLDRDVAFALIKTEGLDDTGRDRIRREAQAMGRLGSHPHIVSVFDLGEEGDGQPYIVTELMGGGDVEDIIEKAPEHRPSLERTLEIGIATCRGLEFAHSHGIVHRDLKPSNVWLTADGTAKLGDFGLAVALDRSRLTQAGMMVGTVSYMPPEQAMGGEVTPRSDLYSLGAMLYELVTGRPPFVGDESVAVITQHLNVAPVSPSWHNPQTPPALETLILRLLEKDPSKRPQSAAEVLQALEDVQRGVRAPDLVTELGASPMDAETAVENPMYRRTFVGREQEIKQLQSAYDAALSGEGGLVMVVGEPGIGKTSLTEQLATYATIRGGRTLVGHCYEEGSLSLPYLPFVEAMRSYVLAREPDGLKSDLGSGAADVARIISEIRDRLPMELREAGDPDDDRWRLLQAVSAFLRNASAVQPLVIVLEDLHDADRGTLDLLTHLARNLQGARLLLVGSYRDVEVDRSHPLSSTLAELRRGQNFSRVPLRGLTAEEVQRMMAGVAQQEVPWPMAEVVHRQTEGNPLFVQEMLRYLVEEGLVERREGSLRRVGEETLAGRIPEGLRDVIGKRLSRLSEQTNQALAVASVIGREFRLDVLQRVAGLGDDALEAALSEAMGISIVEERAAAGAVVTYRFTHAFFRQTLYEETIAPRRIRLHQQVARALEAVYGRRLEEHAAELAEHYAYSSDPADLAKAVEYGELAAQRASAVQAHGEAARFLEQAIAVQAVLDPDDLARNCDLQSRLAEVLIPAGEPRRAVLESAPAALAAAEALNDRTRAARIATTALHGQVAYGDTLSPDWRRWVEIADRYADPDTPMRARADAAYARVLSTEGRLDQSLEMYKRAFETARRAGDLEILFYTAGPVAAGWGPGQQEQRLQVAEEFSVYPRAGVSTRTAAFALTACASTFLAWGQRERAQELWREVEQLSSRSLDLLSVTRPYGIALGEALLDGRLDDAVAAAAALRVRVAELGEPDSPKGSLAATQAAFLLGLGAQTEEPRIRFGPPEIHAIAFQDRRYQIDDAAPLAWWLAQMNRNDEARAVINETRRSGVLAAMSDGIRLGSLIALLETSVLLEERDLSAHLSERLAAVSTLIAIGGYGQGPQVDLVTVIARHLGAASALLGEREAARAYYEQALEVAGKVRFRPEIALTRLGIAELLLEYADEAQRTEALEHLDFAISELREMKMQPSLERALRHKEVLKA